MAWRRCSLLERSGSRDVRKRGSRRHENPETPAQLAAALQLVTRELKAPNAQESKAPPPQALVVRKESTSRRKKTSGSRNRDVRKRSSEDGSKKTTFFLTEIVLSKAELVVQA
ncbi:hypothetical protein V7S43_017174 [Phytophthora oleae]|uniref:Uncharacterized protein n=1 Tax=Phytophthora oleae TaxID=2107226 RepID=A0ABD3EU02_9STRA